jgi:hypothetical protein
MSLSLVRTLGQLNPLHISREGYPIFLPFPNAIFTPKFSGESSVCNSVVHLRQPRFSRSNNIL